MPLKITPEECSRTEFYVRDPADDSSLVTRYPNNYKLSYANNQFEVVVDQHDFTTRKAFYGTQNVIMRPKVKTTTSAGIPDVMPGDSEQFTIEFQDACRAANIKA